MKEMQCVVNSGTGTSLAYLIGSYFALEEFGVKIKELVGTSGGAIIATYYSKFGKAEKLKDFILNLDLKSLVDNNPFYFNGMSLITGNKILDLFRKTLPKDFLSNELKIPVNIISVEFNSMQPVIFNSKNCPFMDLPLALRASISLPFIFTPVEISKANGSHIEGTFIDGGTMLNFAIDYKEDTKDVIGLRLLNPFSNPITKPSYQNTGNFLKDNFSNLFMEINWHKDFPVNFVMRFIEMLMLATEKEHIEDAKYAKVINIKSQHSGFNFEYKKEDILKMISSGKEQTLKQLNVLFKK